MRRCLLPLVLFLLLLAAGCRSEILVEIVTTIYPDGSLDRQLTIHGRESINEPPWEDGTLAAHTGLTLADPSAWDRVETGPTVTRAEGFFPAVADVPPLLAHANAETGSPLPDRGSLTLDRDDLVILDRFRYEESFGDPYGRAGADAALGQVLSLLEDWILDELEKSFPRGVDTDGVHRFMAEEVQPVAREMLAQRSSLPGKSKIEQRVPALQNIFRQHGLPVVSLDLPDEEEPAYDQFWERQTGPLLDWARERLAAAVSTEEETVEPYRLSFLPTSNTLEETATRILVWRWGSEEAGTDALIRWIQAMEGHYGSDSAPRYRFRGHVTLPGIQLRGNGAVENGGWTWFFRGKEMAAGDIIHHAESVVLNLDALRALGARRDFDKGELMNLVDLLDRQDPDGDLKALLRHAVDEGSPELLTDADRLAELPGDLAYSALELAVLLRGQDTS